MTGDWVRATTLAQLGETGRARLAHGDKRIAVFRTATGVRAVDNRCPHQGYSLLAGNVKGDVLTCQWHNWKFDLARDGTCTFGGENVRSYPVEVRGDEVWVDVTDPAPDEISPVLFASLLEAMGKVDVGRIARDTARLRQVGVPLAEVVREGVRYGAPRAEYGWNHSLATLTDCLALSAAFDRRLETLPVVQGLSSVAETQVRRPHRPRPEPVDPVAAYGSVPEALAAFPALVDDEQGDAAEGLLRGLIAYGASPAEVRGALLAAVTDHFLGYGHPMIYAQKAFELLDAVGWREADDVLSPLVPATVLSTRYDNLPYMRRFRAAWQAADLDLPGLLRAQGGGAGRPRTGYERAVLDEGPEGAFDAVHTALKEGVPVEAIVDATLRASAERFRRFDLDLDLDDSKEWGWLDVTHTLTYLAAFRWAWSVSPTPEVLRGLFHAVWFVQWTQQFDTPGGAREAAPYATGDPADVLDRIRRKDPDGAVAAVRGYHGPERGLYDAVAQAATEDNAVAPIMVAHAVKVARAAVVESARTGDRSALVGAARFLAAPKRERFVRNATLEAIDFVAGRARDEA